jgi:hypothetical protein
MRTLAAAGMTVMLVASAGGAKQTNKPSIWLLRSSNRSW